MNQYVLPSRPAQKARPFSIEADGASHGGWLRDLGLAYENAGEVLVAEGLFAPAHEKYEAALYIFERLATGQPHDPNWQIDLASCYTLIGDLYASEGKPDRAVPPYRSSQVIWQGLAASDPGNAAWRAQLLRSQTRLALCEQRAA